MRSLRDLLADYRQACPMAVGGSGPLPGELHDQADLTHLVEQPAEAPWSSASFGLGDARPGSARPSAEEGALLATQLAPVVNLISSVVTSQIDALKESIFSQLRTSELRLSIQVQALQQLFDYKIVCMEERVGVLEQLVMQLRVKEVSMHEMVTSRVAATEKRLALLECDDPHFYSDAPTSMGSYGIDDALAGSLGIRMDELSHALPKNGSSSSSMLPQPPMPRGLGPGAVFAGLGPDFNPSDNQGNKPAGGPNQVRVELREPMNGTELGRNSTEPGREHVTGEPPSHPGPGPVFLSSGRKHPWGGELPSLQTHGPMFSEGSREHPYGCKPCSFFYKRGCKKITSCEYCHMEHRARPRKRTK